MFQRGVETFLAVVRFKTLKGAADRLHLAQSTVSKRLQQLEEECGIVLFERGKGAKEAVLTPEGERFAGVAERMLDLFHEARNFQPGQTGYVLRIGAVTSMHSVFIPDLCAGLVERVSGMRVAGLTLYSTEMYDAIDVRRIDAAFCLLERTHPNVAREQCYSEPIVGVRLADEYAVNGEQIRLDSLDPEREISFLWTSLRFQEWNNDRFSGEGAKVLVDDPAVVFRILRSPGQWALVPLSVARQFFLGPAYQIFRPLPEPLDRVCYLLTHKHPRRQAAASIALFRKHMPDAMREWFGDSMNGRNTELYRSWAG